MQCIYNYIPKTNHVTTVYNVAAVLYLQFVLHVMLLSMLNMLCTFTLAYYYYYYYYYCCYQNLKSPSVISTSPNGSLCVTQFSQR